MIGYAWSPGILPSATDTNQVGYGAGAGISLGAGASLSLITDNNFKIKAFGEYQTIGAVSQKWLHSILFGWSAAWVW